MPDSPQLEPPRTSIREEDILPADVPRRSFLRGLGALAGTVAVTTAGTGCATMGGYSDRCDPVRSDDDPDDPMGAASDSDNAVCDSD